MSREDIAEQLKQIKKEKKVRADKKRARSRSRLEKYKGEILELKDQGASLEDMRLWLRKYKSVSVNRSTIHRKLRLWYA